jgi:hypothetical protein
LRRSLQVSDCRELADSRRTAICCDCLGLKPNFPLVPDRENANFVARDHKPIQPDVTGMTVRNDQFAQFAFEAPPYQRVSGEVLDRRLDCRHGALCGVRVFVAQELESALDVIESSR